MEQPQQRSRSMVFVLVVSAVLLAVATFLTILLVTSRSSSPSALPEGQVVVTQPDTIFVNGVPIVLNVDPNKVIRLEGETNSQPIVESDNQGGVPTDTPPPPPTEGPTATPPPPPAPTRDPNPVIFISYTVVQGDNLYSIAEAQNSSIELMAKHGIDAGNLIPGAVLERLPIANPAYCPGMQAYVVRDKDTVFRIAVQFGISVEAIAVANGLDASYRVDVTQVICIPV